MVEAIDEAIEASDQSTPDWEMCDHIAESAPLCRTVRHGQSAFAAVFQHNDKPQCPTTNRPALL